MRARKALDCTFSFVLPLSLFLSVRTFSCDFLCSFLLVVGEPYYDRLGRSAGRKQVYRKAHHCRLGSMMIYDYTHTLHNE